MREQSGTFVVLAGTCFSPEKFIVKFRGKRKGVFPDFF